VHPRDFDRFEQLARLEASKLVPREAQSEYLRPTYKREGLRLAVALGLAVAVAVLVLLMVVFA
jgi:hypothetical protein